MAISNIRPASYQVASRGVTPADLASGLATKQPLDPTLTGLAALDSALGLVEETAPNVFTKRAIGAANSNWILQRSDSDARYRLQSVGITGPDLVDGSVSSAKIADNSIGPSDLANNCVTTAKIADGAVTNAKLADSYAPYSLVATVSTKQPLDPALTALAGLSGAGPGLIEQTTPDVFGTREIGVVADTSVLTRGDGDARYAPISSEDSLADIDLAVTHLLTGVTGTNALVATVCHPPAAPGYGIKYRFVAPAANTGAVTLTVPGGSAMPVHKFDSRSLEAGDFPNGGKEVVVWSTGTTFIVTSELGPWNSHDRLEDVEEAVADLAGEKQALDPTLTALAGLNAAVGLVEQTAPDVFTKRPTGVADATSILTRADGDGRYLTPAGGDARYAGLDANEDEALARSAADAEIIADVASLMSLQFGRPGEAPELYRTDLAGGYPFGPSPFPTTAVSAYQMRRALASLGLQDEVYAMLGDQDTVPRIQWGSAAPIVPADALAANIQATLGYTSVQMEDLFTLARSF